MRQVGRFLVQPGTYFNQLQWSRHHWYIMLAFLMVSAVEAYVGNHKELYRVFAHSLTGSLGISFDTAMWLVVAAKIAIVLFASSVVAHAIWFVGSFFGERNSKRVLFRRLSVVFTVLLAGYTATHLELMYPALGTAALFLFLWGAILGYFALREQFSLNASEAFLMSLIAALILIGGWRTTNFTMQTLAETQMTSIAKQGPNPAPRY